MSSEISMANELAKREAAERFLTSRINYEQLLSVPYPKRQFKLDRMRQLLDRLDSPHERLPVVHIAGTKGKGSTATMIGAVLTASGYRTGVFSSPHLDRVEERIAIDDRCCSPAELVELVELVKPAVEAMDEAAVQNDPEDIEPTYFEITTAMAWLQFARRQVDVAVLEVGLGGRLDSTNVCRPRVSVITSVDFDHMRQLGNTLASIAREKAGIIKPGVPVVSGVGEEEPREVIRETCRRQGCRLVELGIDFDFDYRSPRHLEQAPAAGSLDFHYQARGGPHRYENLPLAAAGRHQAANAAVALAALAELRQAGWTIPEAAIRRGLAHAAVPARVEVMSRWPAIVVDAAHNPASIGALVRVLDESFSVARRWLVFAATQEKDARGMLEQLLGRFDEVIFTHYVNNPRAVPPEELQTLAYAINGRRYPTCADPTDALETARRRARQADLICVTGSFFLAAELRSRLASDSLVQPAATKTEEPA
jgi:dihydrofolate synthase/folylpolyglutamate synthase